jgi:hypothetical protein
MYKKWPVKGLCGRCLSVCDPEPHTSLLHTVYVYTVYCTYLHGEGGGGGGELNQREGRNYNMTDCTVSPVYSINSDKHLMESPFTLIYSTTPCTVICFVSTLAKLGICTVALNRTFVGAQVRTSSVSSVYFSFNKLDPRRCKCQI